MKQVDSGPPRAWLVQMMATTARTTVMSVSFAAFQAEVALLRCQTGCHEQSDCAVAAVPMCAGAQRPHCKQIARPTL